MRGLWFCYAFGKKRDGRSKRQDIEKGEANDRVDFDRN